MSRGTNTLGAVFFIVGLAIALASSVVMIVAQTANFAGCIALAIGVCVALLGAFFMEPDATKAAVTSLGSSVGPYLPTFGRRSTEHDAGGHGD